MLDPVSISKSTCQNILKNNKVILEFCLMAIKLDLCPFFQFKTNSNSMTGMAEFLDLLSLFKQNAKLSN